MRFSPFQLIFCASLFSTSAIPAHAQTPDAASGDFFNDGRIHLVVRCDDIGFCHAANVALDRVATEGVVSAASVIVNTPWLDEAVAVLARNPEISVGVHLALNCEWDVYRWGPVSPTAEVPSLVDEWGNLFPTCAVLNANEPRGEEIEHEMRAQLDLALRKGLRVSYLDAHMGAATESAERREMLERVARDHGLAISCWFGERQGPQIYSVPPEQKLDSMLAQIRALTEPGLYLTVLHPGLASGEMEAIEQVDPAGLAHVAAHRQAETDVLCSPQLHRLLDEREIDVVSYDELRERFLDRMRSPVPNR